MKSFRNEFASAIGDKYFLDFLQSKKIFLYAQAGKIEKNKNSYLKIFCLKKRLQSKIPVDRIIGEEALYSFGQRKASVIENQLPTFVFWFILPQFQNEQNQISQKRVSFCKEDTVIKN